MILLQIKGIIPVEAGVDASKVQEKSAKPQKDVTSSPEVYRYFLPLELLGSDYNILNYMLSVRASATINGKAVEGTFLTEHGQFEESNKKGDILFFDLPLKWRKVGAKVNIAAEVSNIDAGGALLTTFNGSITFSEKNQYTRASERIEAAGPQIQKSS